MADCDNDAISTSWHLDKRIPIALIITLLLQTGGALMWAANVNTRMDYVERASGVNSSALSEMQTVKYRLDSLDQQSTRIEAKLDRIIGGGDN